VACMVCVWRPKPILEIPFTRHSDAIRILHAYLLYTARTVYLKERDTKMI